MEVPARGPDSRSEDPQATQKISRETLEAVLKGTKSGFRPAVRSEPDLTGARAQESFEGPRDDAPQITITGIHSMEFDAIDPATIAAMSASFEASSSSSMRAAASADRISTPAPVTSPVTSFVPIPVPKGSSEGAIARATPRRAVLTTRLHITRRMAFVAGVVVAVVMTVAALVGFFAGRLH